MRIDHLLVSRGLFDSRAQAQAAIEAGRVKADGVVVRKSSEKVAETAGIEAEPAHRWVGRGALKLDHALTLWSVQVEGADGAGCRGLDRRVHRSLPVARRGAGVRRRCRFGADACARRGGPAGDQS